MGEVVVRTVVTAGLSHGGTIVQPDASTEIPNVRFNTKYSLCKIEAGSSYKLRWLVERWKWCNQHLFGGDMKEPKFEIVRGEKRLGWWSASTKTMAIAHLMFTLKDEGHALGTLIHEMAHQYNSEVMPTPEDEEAQDKATKGHGPTWKAIMRQIGQPTDIAFTGKGEDLLSDKKRKVLDQLKPGTERILVSLTDIIDKKIQYLVHINRYAKEQVIRVTPEHKRSSVVHTNTWFVAGFGVDKLKSPHFDWFPLSNCYVAMPSRVRKDAPQLMSPEADAKYEEIVKYLAGKAQQ